MRLSLEQAWQSIDKNTPQLLSVELPLHEAMGRLLTTDIHAPISQPPFPRSPLDGYALHAIDSLGASRETPKILRVIDRSFAGKPASRSVERGEAVRIMTGAPIPHGADCVIRQEDTDYGSTTVALYQTLNVHDNYCFAGEDYLQGDLLVSRNQRIDAGVCMVLAGAGIQTVPVNALPRVAVISTGSELQSPDNPLSEGKIYDANAAYLQARLAELQLPKVTLYQVDDNQTALEQTFSAALEHHDLIISTGGVSVGEADLTPATLEQLGAKAHFHGVDIKPGMPSAFFSLKGKPILALSGNPFACVVTFELLGRRCIAALSGDMSKAPVQEPAALKSAHLKSGAIRRFFSATVTDDHIVSICGSQQNGKTRMLIGNNCIAELPASNDAFAPGTMISIYRL